MEHSPSTFQSNSQPTSAGVGAVVIGGDHQGLGIVRSLGRHGVPVCVIDDEQSISRFSRYVTHTVSVPSLREEKQAVEILLGVGQRLNLQGWVLYPTRDETVAAISRQKERLSSFFRVPTPAWETVKWAWDKSNTYKLAADLGIPTPRVWQAGSIAELTDLPIEFPVAIKPTIKEHLFYSTKVKAWRANHPAELREYFSRALEHVGPEEVILQELIPGDGLQQFAYCAFYKDGLAVGSMTVRRRRQHPLEFGRSSTYVETVEAPDLAVLSNRFLKAINYYGLVEMEYKLDLRDGRYKLLDVNARTWGYHSLGGRSGVDFSYMLYADQLGFPVGPCSAQLGIAWLRWVTDLPTGLLHILRKDISCWEYLKTVGGSKIEAVFSKEDPLPALMELLLIPYLAVKRGF